jgi:hypothetical protein
MIREVIPQLFARNSLMMRIEINSAVSYPPVVVHNKDIDESKIAFAIGDGSSSGKHAILDCLGFNCRV